MKSVRLFFALLAVLVTFGVAHAQDVALSKDLTASAKKFGSPRSAMNAACAEFNAQDIPADADYKAKIAYIDGYDLQIVYLIKDEALKDNSLEDMINDYFAGFCADDEPLAYNVEIIFVDGLGNKVEREYKAPKPETKKQKREAVRKIKKK